MSNWKDRDDLAYDSDNPEAEEKHAKKLAEKNKNAKMRAALNKALKYYEYTKIHHNNKINTIRAAASALIDALKPYAANRNNAGTIKKIHELINSEYKNHPLNRKFLKNLKNNAKGLADAEATLQKHYNNMEEKLRG